MLRVRHYRDDDVDWWRIRDLLVSTYASSPLAWNWDIRRWDGWRFHSSEPRIPASLAAGIGIWEAEDGRVVGAIHPEGGGDGFLELDPAFVDLQSEMLAWAEEHLSRPDPSGRRTLDVAAWDYDEARRTVLEQRGFEPLGQPIWLHALRLEGSRQGQPMPTGYRLRTTEPVDADFARMASLLNAAFGRTIHTPAEYRNFATGSPSFRADLNLVATAPDGSFASHVGVTYDEVNRHGIFEPVCTHPDHRRRGLALALMSEGLRRLQGLGAETAQVETGDMDPANALYRAVGFTAHHRGDTWRWQVDGYRPAGPGTPDR